MSFFYKFGSSKRQKHLEAEALNLRVLMDCSNQQKFENVKGSKIVKCVQKKYFNYIIDNVSKALVILSWFLLLFLLLYLLIVYISFAFHLEVFQSELFHVSIV